MEASTFLKEQYLRTAFKMFDKDNSGTIDATEVASILGGEDFKDVFTSDQISAAIREVDDNGDGEIDFEEFLKMMKHKGWKSVPSNNISYWNETSYKAERV